MMPFFCDDQIRPHLDYHSVIQLLDAAYTDFARDQRWMPQSMKEVGDAIAWLAGRRLSKLGA